MEERPQEAPLQLARRVHPFRQVGERLAGVLDLRFKEEGVTDVVTSPDATRAARTSLVSRLTATSATPSLCAMVFLSPQSHMLILSATAAASMSSWSLVRCEARKLDLRLPDSPGRCRDRSAQV